MTKPITIEYSSDEPETTGSQCQRHMRLSSARTLKRQVEPLKLRVTVIKIDSFLDHEASSKYHPNNDSHYSRHSETLKLQMKKWFTKFEKSLPPTYIFLIKAFQCNFLLCSLQTASPVITFCFLLKESYISLLSKRAATSRDGVLLLGYGFYQSVFQSEHFQLSDRGWVSYSCFSRWEQRWQLSSL